MAKAFQDADFKKGFFRPSSNTDPEASAGSSALNRDTINSQGLTPNRFSYFRTMPTEIIERVGLNRKELHLADVKTVETSGQGVSNYLGLTKSNLTDASQVIRALNRLWQNGAGTIDQKTNLTKQLISDSIGAERNHDPKIDLIQSLILLSNFQASSTEYTGKAKSVIQNIAVDALNRYHSPSKQAHLIQDPRIKNIARALLQSGNIKDSQRLLTRLIFHEVKEEKGTFSAFRRLFKKQ